MGNNTNFETNNYQTFNVYAKVPFCCTERACVVFFWFQDLPWKKDMMSKVSQVLRTAGVH